MNKVEGWLETGRTTSTSGTRGEEWPNGKTRTEKKLLSDYLKFT